MMFDIYTFGSGSYVVEALHAIKMFMGSSSYSTLARIAGLIGLLWVLLAALRNRGGGVIQADWSWLLFFLFFYTGLIVPKVDVVIIDGLDPPGFTRSAPVVTGVPLGIGALAYITSGVGHVLVDKYETYISIPGDQKYSQNGMLFGSSVMRAFGDMEFPDARYASDMHMFTQHCLFPLLATGVLPLDGITTSTDLWTYLKPLAPRNRWVEFADGAVRTCADAVTVLERGMATQVNTAAAQAGQKLWPTKTLSSAQAAFLASAGGTTATDFLGITQTSADLTRQAMMVKAIGAALEGASIDADNGAMAQAVFQAKAEAQQRNTYLTMGNMAARTLPVMKAVLEAMAYALAPLVFLFVLMPGGLAAFGQYALFMVWLQLWPVLYAIINSILYWYGSQGSIHAALLADGSHGLTLESLNPVFAVNADMVALAGYLALSIPMVTYMLIRGGMNAGGSVYSSLMQPASGAAAATASEQTNGALSMNSLTMDTAAWGNMSAHKLDANRSLAWGMSSATHPASGATTTWTSAGDAITTMLKSDYAYATQTAAAVRSSVNASAGHSMQAARTDAAEYLRSTASVFQQMRSFSQQAQQASGVTDTRSQQQSTQLAQALDHMQQAGGKLAASTGLSLDDSIALLGRAGRGIGLGGDASAASREAYNQAVEVAQQTGFRDSMQAALALSSQLAATHQQGTTDAAARQLQASLQQNHTLAEKAGASFQQAESWSRVQARLAEHGVSLSGEIGNLLQRELGVTRDGFVVLQRRAEQGDGGALQQLQALVDQFVAQHGETLLGLQAAPQQAGTLAAAAAFRDAVMQTGHQALDQNQAEAQAATTNAAQAAGLDASAAAPEGYDALRRAAAAGMEYDHAQLQAGREALQTTSSGQAERIGHMSGLSAPEAALHRASDHLLDALPTPLGDGLQALNHGLVEATANASGALRGAAGSLERAASGQPQDWASDFNAGYARVAGSSALNTSPYGSTLQIRQELFGADAPASSAAATPQGNPVAGGGRISSGFGMRPHPLDHVLKMHEGVDIAAPAGARVAATAAGVVTFAGERGGYGNLVILDHGNGLETRYAHLQTLGVAAGQRVDQNTPLGTVGSTGKSTGNHLHYEVRENGQPVDPQKYLG